MSITNNSRGLRQLLNASVLFVATSCSCTMGASCTAADPVPVAGEELAVFTTDSGTWRVVPVTNGYRWTLDENPGWSSVMACNTTTSSQIVMVDGWSLLVPAYACKFAQESAPVTLSASRIQAAVAADRWIPYRASLADDWPSSFGAGASQPGSLANLQSSTYNPAALNGTSSSDSLVGVISPQGGEYPTSRGAADDVDAEIIARALNGESITRYSQALYNAAFASAGYPYRTPFNGNMLRDPQKPVSGPQYEFRVGGQEVLPEIESIDQQFQTWSYDSAHLANTGWALWLATEDPRIGLIVQSHAAFALATREEYLREPDIVDGHMQAYRCNDYQTRATYNCLTAMWRARDVATRVGADDVILWSANRVIQMYNDTTSQIASSVAQITNAPRENSTDYVMKITSAPVRNFGCSTFNRADGSTFSALGRSNFEDVQYGAVPVYLRAQAGEALGKTLMNMLGKHMVARTLYLGGAAGIDGRRDFGGSTIPLGPCEAGQAVIPPFDDGQGWASWIESQNIITVEGTQPPRDALTGAYAHTAIQTQFILRAAQQLSNAGAIDPVEDIDSAVDALDQALSRTPADSLRFQIWYKHVADLLD